MTTELINDQYIRTRIIMGSDAIDRLHQARVAVFGLGGVGGYVVEALARGGIGELDIVDNDEVVLSNLNRQIIATHETLGLPKTKAAAQRIRSIDENIIVHEYPCFYLPDKKDLFPFDQFDYIVDAIDTVTAKLDLIEEAHKRNIPIICAMGCGNRLDPSKLVITDIYKTSGDPLAKVMRKELKKRGIRKLRVVYSTEKPLKPLLSAEDLGETNRRSIPGSSAFVPSAAGLFIASAVCRELSQFDPESRAL